jgi:hypothetical protein
MIALVHAQIFSTSRVLRSRWTEVSRGDCIFPCAFFNLVRLQKQEERQKGCDGAVLLGSGRAYLLQQLLRRSADCRKGGHHEKLCSVRSTLLAGSETHRNLGHKRSSRGLELSRASMLIDEAKDHDISRLAFGRGRRRCAPPAQEVCFETVVRPISAPRRPTQRVRYRRVQKRACGRISPRALSIFVEFVLNAGRVNIRVQAIGART